MAIDRQLTRQSATLRSVTALRGLLLLVLVIFESVDVSDSYGSIAGTALWAVPTWSIAALFALAGFTTMRGIDRQGLPTIATRMAVRLLPALVLIIVLTVTIGLIATTDTLRAYLKNADSAAYLLNIIGIPRYSLPGIFEFNASAGIVNKISWTFPVIYLAIGVTALTRIRPSWPVRGLSGIGLLLAIIAMAFFFADPDLLTSNDLLGSLLAGQGLVALLTFIAGSLVFLLRRHVVTDWRIAGVAMIVLAAMAIVGDQSMLANVPFDIVTVLPIAYLAVYAGSLPLPLRHWMPRIEPLFWRIFLCAYPIQQGWVAFGPDRQSGIINLLLSAPVIGLAAGGEWFLVERPILRRFFPAGLVPSRRLAPPTQRRGGTFRALVREMRAALPMVVGAVFVVLLVLVALAMTMFAMKHDSGGT